MTPDEIKTEKADRRHAAKRDFRLVDKYTEPYKPAIYGIDTAPRDGTRIIVLSFKGAVPEWVSGAHWVRRVSTLPSELGLVREYWTDGMDRLAEPTHWMPMPTGVERDSKEPVT